uniref:SH3 and cysteine-rich domain-containing protein 2 n=1 Tax=Periophthalmus magnuspinnatus TaxID=409849 RepID=A0A3B3Z741_9GOBI
MPNCSNQRNDYKHKCLNITYSAFLCRIASQDHTPSPTANKLFLQRLKRSLSFKSVMRSKSVDNFFQRNGDTRPPSALITTACPASSPLAPSSDSPLGYERSPSLSPSAMQPMKTHCFQEHVFRRATNCQRCKHVIQGNSKQGLRCKACKLAAHLWCSSELSQLPCNGKVSYCSTTFQYAPPRETSVVDPVYEALRYGTSLAQMSRSSFSSISESPYHEVKMLVIIESVFILLFCFCLQTPKRVEIHSIHTYVALYKFLPQEKNDLELQPGDRIQVTDDSNEDWWKGKIRDRVGFFPANFVQRVRPGERVWKVTAGFHGNRDKGQMSVKEAQICVGKNEEIEGFVRLSSGKKRGMVPVKNVMEI